MLSSRLFTLSLFVLAALSLLSCSAVNEGEREKSGLPVLKITLYNENSAGRLKVELENVSSAHLLVVTWVLPTLEGSIEGDEFDVKECSGNALSYRGILVSRVGIAADEVIYLQPGEKILRPFNLVHHYGLEEAKCYTVQFDSCFIYTPFQDEKKARQFLQKFEKSPTLGKMTNIECIKSNILKIEPMQRP